MLSLFKQYRLFTKPRSGERWQVNETVFFDLDVRIEPYAHIFGGAIFPCAIGAFSYTHSKCDHDLKIGRYCSIAKNVAWMGDAHPTQWATTSPVTNFGNPLGGLAAYIEDRAVTVDPLPFDQGSLSIDIGHDVWIGQNVVIKRGLTIGHGAVIGAGSIVTKSVPPYAIVAGNPATLIRYRFSEALIDRLLRSAWWQYGPDVIQPLDPRDAQGFVDRLEELDAAPLVLEPMTGSAILAAARGEAHG